MNSSDDRPRRNFDPKKTGRYGRPPFHTDKLVQYSPKWQYSRLFNFPFHGSHWRPRMNTLVVQVQGIAIPNSKNDALSKAGFGVSFGPRCPHNISEALHPSQPPTSNRAVLEAVMQALQAIAARKMSGEFDYRWKEIIVMLNSEYVGKSLEKWAWKWEEHGWDGRNGGKRIENKEVMRSTHEFIKYLEGELNMAVRFWKVGREDVADADHLAQLAVH